jgi:hypothetical protein
VGNWRVYASILPGRYYSDFSNLCIAGIQARISRLCKIKEEEEEERGGGGGGERAGEREGVPSLCLIPEKNQFRGEKIYFGSWFRKLRLWSAGSIISGLVMRQNIMAQVFGGTELLTSWQPVTERDTEQSRQNIAPPQDVPPVAYFL